MSVPFSIQNQNNILGPGSIYKATYYCFVTGIFHFYFCGTKEKWQLFLVNITSTSTNVNNGKKKMVEYNFT